MDQTYPRSLYEARLDAECYAVSHELHARLWRRFRTLTRLCVGFSGSAAFGGWVATRADIAGMAGIALAFLAALDQAIDPSDKIARHRAMAQRYQELKRAAAAGMELALFDARLDAIKAEDEAGIDALLTRAFNRVVVAAGRPEFKLAESTWHRFVAFFA
jgi:hypothetical protein